MKSQSMTLVRCRTHLTIIFAEIGPELANVIPTLSDKASYLDYVESLLLQSDN